MCTIKKCILHLVLFFILLTQTSVFAQTSPSEQSPSLSGLLTIENPAQPVLVLKNTGKQACAIINTSYGTVSISQFIQDGKAIQPIPIQTNMDDSMEVLFERNLKILQPGEETEMKLPVFPYKSNTSPAGLAIQTITWSKATGSFGMVSPFAADKPYQLEVTYQSPVVAIGEVALCGSATATTNDLSASNPLRKALLIGIFVLLLVLGIVILYRIRKKSGKKAAAILLLLTTSALIFTAPVSADYSVPTDATAQFDACMAIFNEHPEITDPILSDIDPETIYIFTNDDHYNDATDWPDGSYHVHWDPESEYTYPGGDGVVSNPCDRLFHELYHVYEISNRTNDRGECGGSGIPIAEVNAVRAQNALREAMGLPPRTHYGHDPLPSGDCDEEPEPPPPPSFGCGFSCASSWGDPHLRTFDMVYFDFQAVGEFTLSTDSSGEFEVQVRQQAWPKSRSASVNTAVAMQVMNDVLELKVQDGKFVIIENGKQTALESKMLASGGTIETQNGNYAYVTWPDGSMVKVHFYNTYGLDIFIQPSETRKQHLAGVMGNFNENREDDLKIRGSDNTIQPEFDQLYPAFADSWRVTKDSSLFTYEAGTSTETFTDRSLPEKYLAPDQLTNRASAERICKAMGITDPGVLESCIFDVAVTNRPDFAYSASYVQKAFAVAPQTTDATWNMVINKPGDSVSEDFEATEGDILFFEIPRTSFPGQCGGFGVRNAEDTGIATGCITSGSGFVDRFEIPASGTYSFFFQPSAGATGNAAVKMHKVTDVTGNIIPGGKPFDVKLDTPGAIAKLNFNGVTGQRISVKFLESTLPGQCGGIQLIAPEGNTIGSTCITDGEGTIHQDGITLDETGTYAISIDPGNTGTGSVQVRVILTDI